MSRSLVPSEEVWERLRRVKNWTFYDDKTNLYMSLEKNKSPMRQLYDLMVKTEAEQKAEPFGMQWILTHLRFEVVPNLENPRRVSIIYHKEPRKLAFFTQVEEEARPSKQLPSNIKKAV